MKVLFLLFVLVCSAFAQMPDSTTVTSERPARPYRQAALVTAVPLTLLGVLALTNADEWSDAIEDVESLIRDAEYYGQSASELYELRDEYAGRRNTYRVVAYTSFALSAVAVVWNLVGDPQPKHKGIEAKPWWMPKEKAAGISASIQL